MIEPSFFLIFFLSILITFLYTFFGVSGGAFWVPFYFFVMGLSGPIIFWLSLFSTILGSIIGVIQYARQKLIQVQIMLSFLTVAVPFAIIGVWLSQQVNTRFLFGLFSIFITGYGAYLLLQLVSYPRTNTTQQAIVVIGGLLTGLISTGIGTLALNQILKHKQIQSVAEASGTTLAIVFVTVIAAGSSKLLFTPPDALRQYLQIIQIVIIPIFLGSIIGGTLAVGLAKKMDKQRYRRLFGVLLLVIGSTTFFFAH